MASDNNWSRGSVQGVGATVRRCPYRSPDPRPRRPLSRLVQRLEIKRVTATSWAKSATQATISNERPAVFRPDRLRTSKQWAEAKEREKKKKRQAWFLVCRARAQVLPHLTPGKWFKCCLPPHQAKRAGLQIATWWRGRQDRGSARRKRAPAGRCDHHPDQLILHRRVSQSDCGQATALMSLRTEHRHF
jgi:hypothetical protein